MHNSGFRIGEWQVSPRDGMLRAGDTSRRLQPRVMDVLVRLVRSPGEVVSRETLLADVWQGRAMSDEPLHRCVAELRAALGDSSEQPRFIETLPRRGYRLIAPPRPFRSRRFRARALQAAALSALAVLLIGAAVFAAQPQSQLQPPEPPVRRLLVLPLHGLSNDLSHQLLADALTGELINALARRLDLAVMSPGTTFALKQHRGARELRELLQADLLVDGNIRVVDDTLRISVQLIDAHTDELLMSEVCTQPMSIVNEMLADVARTASQLVGASLADQPRAIAASPLASRVHRQFIEAQHLVQQPDKSAVREGIVMLENILRDAPDFAAAYASIATGYYRLRNYDYENPHRFDALIHDNVQHALRLAPELPLAIALSGMLKADEDPVGALDLVERAIELDPAQTEARRWQMLLLYRAGYVHEAGQVMRYIHEREPLSAEANGWLASLELDLANFERFETLVRRSDAMGWEASDTVLFYDALRKGDRDKVAHHIKKRWAHSTRVTADELQTIVDAIFAPEKRPAAIALVHDMLARQRPITRFWAFVWLDLLGAHDDAIELMLRDHDTKDVRILYNTWNHAHRELRAHPRFMELAERFRLPEIWQARGENGYCTRTGATYSCR